MAFKIWQTGVHIQQDRALIVALARKKSGWCLRRWWAIPLDEGIIRDGKICQPEQLVDALRDWRKTLPHYHRVFLSFPAARTLQRTLLRPTVARRDSEQLSWLGAALARELEMSADTLCFDYAQDTFSNTFHVTAAQNNEIDTLLALAKTLRLRLVAITPDASALANLLPAVAPATCVAWRDDRQWLWAMRHQWGRRFTTEAENVSELSALLALGSDDIALFDSRRDPWEILERCHAPLPDRGADYTVALALAMSEVPG
ncbi:DNA utilization protein HofM [Enterobacter asburiae]|uniref:DNA utilization protein HofM n=1 Tax=Enterobacter asburiae TaxID=61645 RepID=A0A8I1G2A3_ENTAS|nr:DNA utilization protein HofM [Enterobacter asburiae]EMB6149979.1 DNA utilization protein HofM [Enterobacter asburiae]MBJ6596409.1 DNA utilization protein HofM [Enterobacter asburiae]MBK4464350.1 DNA utilization protein HofM [Enterobacter asburiae]MBK4573345.1 DNA utilization protein HofM [Enterobacter asburiae]MCQ4371346.1 DNA utilization protein HofM [Enterobacter asburiae]